jgi:hypothetical protein
VVQEAGVDTADSASSWVFDIAANDSLEQTLAEPLKPLPAPITPVRLDMQPVGNVAINQASGAAQTTTVTAHGAPTGDVTTGDVTTGDVTTGDVITGDVTTDGDVTTTGDVASGDVAPGDVIDTGDVATSQGTTAASSTLLPTVTSDLER